MFFLRTQNKHVIYWPIQLRRGKLLPGSSTQSPGAAAGYTRLSMNADHFTAIGALPALLLQFNKAVQSKRADVFKVFDHAHAVIGPVACIQFSKAGAGKFGTIIAVLLFESRHFFTSFKSTGFAVFLFIGFVAHAARTWFFLAQVTDANSTVHPARGYHEHVKRINKLLSFCIHGHGPCLPHILYWAGC